VLGGYVITAHPNFMVTSVVHTLESGLMLPRKSYFSHICLMGQNEEKHADILVFQFSGQSLLLSP
jgi:hypothetical protein